MVFHAVLRDFACGTGQTVGIHPVWAVGDIATISAMAGSSTSEVHSLQRLDLQSRIDDICDYIFCLGMAWYAVCGPGVCKSSAILCDHLFRVLHFDAVLHDDRQDEARAGKGGLP